MAPFLTRVLFLCDQKRARSLTAEQLFAGRPGIACASAGLCHETDAPLSAEQLVWADLIFVMEPEHRARLADRFNDYLAGKRVICLGILDSYRYMDPALVTLLRIKVTPHLSWT